MRTYSKIAGFVLLLMSGSGELFDVTAQDPDPPHEVGRTDARDQPIIVRIRNQPLSELFASAGAQKADVLPDISTEQAHLMEQLDKLAREIICEQLQREADENPNLPAAELAARLSASELRLKSLIVSHAESISLEGILTQVQAERWRKATKQHTSIHLIGRYGPFPPSSGEPDPHTAGEVYAYIQGLARNIGPRSYASSLFAIAIDKRSKLYVSQTSVQDSLSNRMNAITRDILRAWLLRDLDSEPPLIRRANEQPSQAMQWKISLQGWRARCSILAHAEAIELSGVLLPQQAEEMKNRFWQQRGLDSLWDPELAARLGLSKGQRETLGTLLEPIARQKTQLAIEMVVQKLDTQSSVNKGNLTTQQGQSVNNESDLVYNHTETEIEKPVWEVLTDAQSRALHRILEGRFLNTSSKEVKPRNPAR